MSITFEIDTDTLVTDALLIINELLESNIILDEHSPAVALIEAIAYTIKELTYYIEQVPARSLIMAIQEASSEVFGESVKASGQVTLFMSQPLPTNWTIPTLTVYSQNGLLYVSDGSITVPAGHSSVAFSVTAQLPGAVYNQASGAIIGYVGVIYPQISSVINQFPITGGADELDLESRLLLATKTLHRRGALITASDYQDYIRGLYPGSAVLVGNVNAVGVTEKGKVTSFVLLNGYQTLTLAQKVHLTSLINQHSLLGIANQVEDLSIQEICMEVILEIYDSANPLTLYEELKTAYLNFLDPYYWDNSFRSVNIKQLELITGKTEGVRLVQGVYLADNLTSLKMPINLPIPLWALPRLIQLSVKLISYPSNNQYSLSNTFYEELPEG